MKNIELTEEHKSKLLEMCEKLFPEYDFTLDKWEQCFVTLGLKSKVAYDSHIHWFEFCMTHLVDKIYETRLFNGTEPPFISMVASRINCGHIIDYLYEEFKKLK